MNTHPYLRAFLAGAFIPTLILPIMLTGFVVLRLILQVPFPFERGIIFPMALVPSLWALWNMLWIGSRRMHLPIGVHGALLPFLLLPSGALLATALHILSIGAGGVTWFNSVYVPYTWIVPVFCAAIAVYYLMWKYVVGFLNRTLGIA